MIFISIIQLALIIYGLIFAWNAEYARASMFFIVYLYNEIGIINNKLDELLKK